MLYTTFNIDNNNNNTLDLKLKYTKLSTQIFIYLLVKTINYLKTSTYKIIII